MDSPGLKKYNDRKGALIRNKNKAFPRGENENDEAKIFPGGERTKANEVAKTVLGTTSRNRWKNLGLYGSPPM